MNAPDFKYWGLMALILLCCLGILAVRQPADNPVRPSGAMWFEGVAAPEIPTVAVRALQGGLPGRRMVLVNQMLQELVGAQPGVVPYFLAAVSRQYPEMASWLLVEAIALQPGQMVASVRAVIAAVPERMEELVSECVKSLPDAFPLVAILAAEQQPESAEAIVKALAKALPEARPALESAMSRQQQFPLSVRQVLVDADRLIERPQAPLEGGSVDHGGTRGLALLHSGNNYGASQSPFAGLQHLARTRMQRINQKRFPEGHRNSKLLPDTRKPSVSSSAPSASVGAASNGPI